MGSLFRGSPAEKALSQARKLYDQGDFVAALEQVDASLAAGGAKGARICRAQILAQLGQLEPALEAAVQALPENRAEATRVKVHCLFGLGRRDLGTQAYSELLGLDLNSAMFAAGKLAETPVPLAG